MMMAPPQVVGVLLKKPGGQNPSRLSLLDPQDTKIRGELYVEDLNERRIVSVRMGWLWVEGTQMRLPLRALNLRQTPPGICQPHVLALGFTLSNSQGNLLATFWADTEPIYWSWVRAIAAELVRQTPFRAQRCLNFLEILTICPRGPVPLPDSPTETRRRSRSELRCWLGDAPMSIKSARSVSILEDSRRRSRSELRGWSSSNSSDEDLHLGEFRSIKTSLLPKVETTLTGRVWGCSESSEGSDDSLPWLGGCRSSVDSIDSAPSIPEPDTRELRMQRYKEARRRENEARSRKVLEEDAKRRKARLEENNNNNNNERTVKTMEQYDTRNHSNNPETTLNNIKTTSNDPESTLNNVITSNNLKTTSNNPETTLNNVKTSNNVKATSNNLKTTLNNVKASNNVKTTSNNATTILSVSEIVNNRLTESSVKPKTTEHEKTGRNNRNSGKTTKTTVVAVSYGKNIDVVGSKVSQARKDSIDGCDNALRDNRNNAVTTKTTTTTTTTSFDKIAENGAKAARKLSETCKESSKPTNYDGTSRDRRNNAETKTTSRTTETTKTTDPFVRAAEEVDAITRRLPPLRESAQSPIVRFRENIGNRQQDAKNNNNKTTNYNNSREICARLKPESPPSPNVVRTDSGERRSRARERRNTRENKPHIVIVDKPQQLRIPENSLKTTFLQERRERLSLMSRIPIVTTEDCNRGSSVNSRIFEITLECRERGAVSLPRTTGLSLVDDTKTTDSSCEDEVARLLERCQRVDRYVPVKEKLTLFESLSRMGGRLARSTEDLGRSTSRPSPKGKQRARSLHDLNRAARSLPVREMCRLFEGEIDGNSLNAVSTGQQRLNDCPSGRGSCSKDLTSILKNNGGNQDLPPCVRTSTRRKHYQK